MDILPTAKDADEVETVESILRERVNAVVGLRELGELTDGPPESLIRLLSPSGNAQARNLVRDHQVPPETQERADDGTTILHLTNSRHRTPCRGMTSGKEVAAVLVLEATIAPALGYLVAVWLGNNLWLAAVWMVLGLLGFTYIYREQLGRLRVTWERAPAGPSPSDPTPLPETEPKSTTITWEEIKARLYTCPELACVCAGFEPSLVAVNHPEVKSWMHRLNQQSNFFLGSNIDNATRQSLETWMLPLHGAIRGGEGVRPDIYRLYLTEIESMELKRT